MQPPKKKAGGGSKSAGGAKKAKGSGNSYAEDQQEPKEPEMTVSLTATYLCTTFTSLVI